MTFIKQYTEERTNQMSNMPKIKYPKAIEGKLLTRKKFKLKSDEALLKAAQKRREAHKVRDKKVFTLQQIFELIDTNRIYLPAFQRDTSWRIQDRVKLLNFMLYGHSYLVPLAMNKLALSTAEGEYARLDPERTPITEKERTEELKNASQTNDSIMSLVDGYQRVSTLNFCRKGTEEVETIFYDVLKFEFVGTTRPKGSCIHVYELLCDDDVDNYDFFNQFVSSLPKKLRIATIQELQKVRQKLLTYSFNVLETSGLTSEDELKWFVKLNDSGVTLTQAQLEMSPLTCRGFRFTKFSTDFRAIVNSGVWYANGIDLMPKITTQVSMPAASLTVPTAIIKCNGQVSLHNLNYSPILSDVKTKEWGTKWVEDHINAVEIAEKMASVSLRALEAVVNFWDANNLQKAGLELTNDQSNPNRLRRDHLLYSHGYILWKYAADFVLFMADSTKEAVDAKTLEFKLEPVDGDYIITWMKNNSLHNKSNAEKRELFKELIN